MAGNVVRTRVYIRKEIESAMTRRTRWGIAVSPKAGSTITMAPNREKTRKNAKTSAGKRSAKAYDPFRNKFHEIP